MSDRRIRSNLPADKLGLYNHIIVNDMLDVVLRILYKYVFLAKQV